MFGLGTFRSENVYFVVKTSIRTDLIACGFFKGSLGCCLAMIIVGWLETKPFNMLMYLKQMKVFHISEEKKHSLYVSFNLNNQK